MPKLLVEFGFPICLLLGRPVSARVERLTRAKQRVALAGDALVEFLFDRFLELSDGVAEGGQGLVLVLGDQALRDRRDFGADCVGVWRTR